MAKTAPATMPDPGDGVGVGVQEARWNGVKSVRMASPNTATTPPINGQANDANQKEQAGPQEHAAADDEGRAGEGENERVPEQADEGHQAVGSVLV